MGPLAFCGTASNATLAFQALPGGVGAGSVWSLAEPVTSPALVLGDKGKKMSVKCLWLCQRLLGQEGDITGIRVDRLQGC